MSSRKILFYSLFIIGLVAALHISAMNFYLYWSYAWFDYLVHFLAGVGGGLAAFACLFNQRSPLKNRGPVSKFILTVSALMFWGVAWEYFEYKNGWLDHHESSWQLDVLMDLLMDFSGAVLATIFSLKKHG